MAVERTEDEGITADVLHITMGGQPYRLRPLTIRESDEWVGMLSAMMSTLEEVHGDDGDEILRRLLLASTEAALALLLAYDHDHVLGDEEHIRDTASKRELKAALEQMVTVEDPFGEADAHSVVVAFGLPSRMIAAGLEAVSEPLLRLVRSQSSPSPIGDSTTPATSIPAGPASNSSSTGRTRTRGSAGKPESKAS
jgi:hypothetical protein